MVSRKKSDRAPLDHSLHVSEPTAQFVVGSIALFTIVSFAALCAISFVCLQEDLELLHQTYSELQARSLRSNHFNTMSRCAKFREQEMQSTFDELISRVQRWPGDDMVTVLEIYGSGYAWMTMILQRWAEETLLSGKAQQMSRLRVIAVDISGDEHFFDPGLTRFQLHGHEFTRDASGLELLFMKCSVEELRHCNVMLKPNIVVGIDLWRDLSPSKLSDIGGVLSGSLLASAFLLFCDSQKVFEQHRMGSSHLSLITHNNFQRVDLFVSTAKEEGVHQTMAQWESQIDEYTFLVCVNKIARDKIEATFLRDELKRRARGVPLNVSSFDRSSDLTIERVLTIFTKS